MVYRKEKLIIANGRKMLNQIMNEIVLYLIDIRVKVYYILIIQRFAYKARCCIFSVVYSTFLKQNQ